MIVCIEEAKSAGWFGSPKSSRYRGEAYRQRGSQASWLAVRLESGSSPMRIATSIGSATISTRRGVRRQVDVCEIHRQRNAQHAARLRQHLAELLMCKPGFIDDALASLEVDLTGFCQFDAACRSVQEAQPERLFQAADPPRQRRIPHSDRLGRLTEAPGFHDLDEYRHVVEQLYPYCSNNGSTISVIPSLSHIRFDPSTPDH
jgi:hypothetical protein